VLCVRRRNDGEDVRSAHAAQRLSYSRRNPLCPRMEKAGKPFLDAITCSRCIARDLGQGLVHDVEWRDILGPSEKLHHFSV